MSEDPVEYGGTEGRRRFLGASDAAAACGLSPWRSPLELWLEKTGGGAPQPDSLPMAVGRALEPVVLAALEERLGAPVTCRGERRVDTLLPWRVATLDGCIEPAGVPALVEAKTAGSDRDWGEEGSDQIPLHYMLQVQHALAVTGWALAYVPVLFAGRDFRVYEVPRSAQVIEALTAREVAFWQQVVERTPPDVATSSDVALRYPQDSGATVTASAEVLEAVASLRNVRAAEAQVAAERERLEGIVKLALGEAAALASPEDGSILATWKTQAARRVDQKALAAAYPDIVAQFRRETTSRVLRLK